jgi:hypothetical protein
VSGPSLEYEIFVEQAGLHECAHAFPEVTDGDDLCNGRLIFVGSRFPVLYLIAEGRIPHFFSQLRKDEVLRISQLLTFRRFTNLV